MTEGAVPILPSRDLRETLVFYEGLGFELRHGTGADDRPAPPEAWHYLVIRRGDVWLHFYADPDVDPLSTAGSCYLYVGDADTLHEQWDPVVVPDPATGSRVVAPVDTDYGMREFAVVDRSGNLLRVGSELVPGPA